MLEKIKMPFASKVFKAKKITASPLKKDKIDFGLFEGQQPTADFLKSPAKGENRGTVADVRTEAFFGYDESNFYACVKCFEPHMEYLTERHVSRKREIILFPWCFPDDTVELMLDPTADFQQSMHIVVNSSGNIYTSLHKVSAGQMYGNSKWKPENMNTEVEKGNDYWAVGIAVSAEDCGLEKFTDDLMMGFNVSRTRTPVTEKYDLQNQTMAWTTGWTSELIHEAYKFHPIFFGDHLQEDDVLESLNKKRTLYLQNTPSNRNLTHLIKDNDYSPVNPHPHHKIKGKDLWIFAPDYSRFPGLEEKFVDLDPLRGVFLNMGGTFEYGHLEVARDKRVIKAALREVGVLDVNGQNIISEAKICSSPDSENIEALKNSDDKDVALYCRDTFLPVRTFFELQFSEKKQINKILIKHGEPLSGFTFKENIPYKNISSEFELLYNNNGKWSRIPDGYIKDNFSKETEHGFSMLETNALRIEIMNQSYSGIEYSEQDAWKWFFEYQQEMAAEFQDNSLESLLYNYTSENDIKSRPVIIEYTRSMMRECPGMEIDEPMFEPALKSILKHNPEGFLGFFEHEWDSNFMTMSTIKNWDSTGRDVYEFTDNLIPFSNTREVTKKHWEEWLKRLYDRHNGYAVFENSWRLGDHFAMVQNNKMPFKECTPNGHPSMQTEMCFTRGAARQWDKPFGVYLASCFDQGQTCYFGGEADRSEGGEAEWTFSALTGPSAQLYGRMIFLAWFSGASALYFEGPVETHICPKGDRYDISAHGYYLKNLIDYKKKYPQAISSFAPIGILMNYAHGYAVPYQTCDAYGRSGMTTWLATQYNEYDHMVNAFFSEIYPVSRQRIERDNYFLSNSQYGEIFDVIGTNMPEGNSDSEDIMSKYPVLFLLGDMDFDYKYLEKLYSHVNSGGTLVCNCIYEKVLTRFDISAADLCDKNSIYRKDVGQGKIMVTPVDFMLDENNNIDNLSQQLLASLAVEYSPFTVHGDCARLFASRDDGWDIFLFNNKGIFKFASLPTQVDAGKKTEVKVSGINKKEVIIWTKDKSWSVEPQEGNINIEIDPGEFAIVKI